MNTDKTYLGKIMKTIRAKYGVLAKDIAFSLEMSPSYLSAIESGDRRVPENFIKKIDLLLSLTEKEKSDLHHAITRINGERYVYEDMKKEFIKEIHKLFTQLSADNYTSEVIYSMRKKLINIERENRRRREDKIAA